MANKYSSTFSILSTPEFVSITVNGTVYNIGYYLNPTNPEITAAALQELLNALGINCFFGVSHASDNLTVFTNCTNQVINAITLSTGSATVTSDSCDAGEDCTLSTPLADITGTLVIDCDNLQCLTFTDTTGDYSISNTGGYGGPNNPSRSEILSTTFNLWDAGGTTLLGSYTSAWLPSGDGTNSLCLSPQNLGFAPTPGTSYILEYQLNFNGSYCTVLETDFTFPCCGDSMGSNLSTNFSITELLGCGSFNFTDTTGNYDPQSNPGGYGSPNPSYGDIASTLITVTLPDGSVFTFDSFIPTAENPTFNITTQMIGNPAVLLVGVWNITYQVFIAGMCQIGYKSTGVLFSCAALNCINGQIAALLADSCCDEKEVDKKLKLVFEYQAILLAAQQDITCVVGDMEALLLKCSENCYQCGQSS